MAVCAARALAEGDAEGGGRRGGGRPAQRAAPGKLRGHVRAPGLRSIGFEIDWIRRQQGGRRNGQAVRRNGQDAGGAATVPATRSPWGSRVTHGAERGQRLRARAGVQALEQQAHGGGADVGVGLHHGGQRRLHQRAERDAVVAEHGDVARHAQAQALEVRNHADRQQVVGAEEARWARWRRPSACQSARCGWRYWEGRFTGGSGGRPWARIASS